MAEGPPHRCAAFAPEYEPLRQHASLQLARSRVSGPFNFLNPTKATFRHGTPKTDDDAISKSSDDPAATHDAARSLDHETPKTRAEYRWTSRNNRKGRHQLVVKKADDSSEAKANVLTKTRNFRTVLHTIGRMFVEYPYYDISWLVAYVFTWGSIVWVINAFFVWLPLVRPATEFKNEILTGGGITAFIGATIFEVGSVFLMLEAINENRSGCFGWAVREFVDEHHEGHVSIIPSSQECIHHHRNKRNLVGRAGADSRSRSSADEETALSGSGSQDESRSWSWYPSWHDLKTHYLHEIGFLACSAQMFGATIFWISGFTALPGILDHLSPGLEDGIYWTPQVIGGSGFIVSGTLFMLETQKRWYKPAFDVLGWHIGFWNLIGGVGFTLCPAFGSDIESWAQYQASLSTFWGSWAFLIGSLLQLYESLQKHPVDEVT